MSSETVDPAVIRKNRFVLILTIIAFALPALLAYLAHVTGFWQSQGTTNNGTLIMPPVEFDELSLMTTQGDETTPFDREQQWWIAYTVPATCDAACQNSLLQMRQTQKATGAYQQKVSTLLIQHEKSDPSAAQWANENAPDMAYASVKGTQWSQLMKRTAIDDAQDISNAGQIYLIDPMGAVFMTYPRQSEEEAAIKQGKGMLKDLQRVLKLSKIG